jgi:hypothetical protein
VSRFAIRARGLPRRPGDTAAPCGLAFDHAGGPLVVLCGLAGGAGTSTLALALACQAARESAAPVLLCETDSRAGGMAALAGGCSVQSLGELAAAALAGAPLRGAPYIEAPCGVRLIAGAVASELGDPDQMRQVLVAARDAHGLVVVDGGVVGGAGAFAGLAAATHSLLVLPATVSGVARAAQLLGSELVPQSPTALVAIAPAAGLVRSRVLRGLAERHVERLVLVPHAAGLGGGRAPDAELEMVLTGLATILRNAA